MGWNSALPTSATNIVNIPTIHGDQWFAFEQTISEEHSTFSSALSGRHKPGLTAVVSAGATSAVSGISDPASGALVWDSTLGVGKLYIDEWTQFNNLAVSKVSVYRGLDYTIPASANELSAAIPVPFDTESIDILSEYNTTTFTYSPSADGFYLFTGKISLSTVGGVGLISYFSVRSSGDVELYRVGSIARYSLSTDECQIMSNVPLNLLAEYKVRLYVYHNHSSSVILEGGQERSFLKIHRIS